MQTATFAGIVLAVVGISSLTYQEINHTFPSEPADVSALQATTQASFSNQTSGSDDGEAPLAPVLGGVLLIGGVALLASTSHASSGRHL